jgi:hypothetical protein
MSVSPSASRCGAGGEVQRDAGGGGRVVRRVDVGAAVEHRRPPPDHRSSPPKPFMTSLPAVPFSVSAPSVPAMSLDARSSVANVPSAKRSCSTEVIQSTSPLAVWMTLVHPV